jgi:hypothetical protein
MLLPGRRGPSEVVQEEVLQSFQRIEKTRHELR